MRSEVSGGGVIEPPITDNWILSTGSWVDTGLWEDDKLWKDS